MVLDDSQNLIGNPAITIRPRANSESPKRVGGSPLLKQLSSRGISQSNEIFKKEFSDKTKPLMKAITIETSSPHPKHSISTSVPETIMELRVSEE